MTRESTATLARVVATLELALYGSHDAAAPGDPIALANETYRRLTRDRHLIERLVTLVDDAEATDPKLSAIRSRLTRKEPGAP